MLLDRETLTKRNAGVEKEAPSPVAIESCMKNFHFLSANPWRNLRRKFDQKFKFYFSLFYLQIKTETMTETSLSRGASPPNSMNQDYDITRMREDDFERLAVYIVPDVPCERGFPGRAEKTLPRSLALKPSLVLSTPTQPVSSSSSPRCTNFVRLINVLCNCRSKVFGALASYRKAPALVHSKATEHRAIPVISHHGDISGGWVSSVQRSIANLCAVR